MITKGQKISERYQITRLIGEGGMANVYLAHDLILDRDVAIKVLRGDLAEDEKFVRRFQREANAASSLLHPNIVKVYDVGEEDGMYFIVMEYINGKTLKSLIKRRGALTLSEVVDIMLQLTSGIICAHESNIIHRDIKPQNVMILDDGTIKITDFGIATAMGASEITQTNSVMGSVHYLPPEQANGTTATVKSDIYSLGILMYELITGSLPFKGETAVEIAIKQMKDKIPSLHQIDENIPQSVENIILKACAKNPKNRYDSVKDMNYDIKRCLSEEAANDERVEYVYSEHELDETKPIPKLDDDNFMKPKKEEKNNKKNTIIISALITFIIIIFAVFLYLFLKPSNEVKETKIPDVSKMTLTEAEEKLKASGFEVNTEVKEENSDDIEEKLVIGTSPAIGRTVKSGSEITIIISIGSDKIEIEDYTGLSAEAVKTSLENKGLIVTIDTKKVDDMDEAESGKIIAQNKEAGSKLSKGDLITLYIADIYVVYPDFVNDSYTEEDALEFCEKNSLNCTFIYSETDEYDEGLVIAQSRSAGVPVYADASLKLTISKEVTTKATDDDETSSSSTSKTSTSSSSTSKTSSASSTSKDNS